VAWVPVVGPVLDFFGKIVDRAIPDKDLAAKLKAQAQASIDAQSAAELQANLQLSLAQTDINKVEAANPKLFVSGWRPAIGWSCAVALFCYYVPYTIAATVLWVIQVYHTGSLVPRPDLGVADLLGLVGTMLGTATLRTAEKFKGVAAI
jgi:Holin of 3TMs, for gene-transfer release